MNANGHRFKDRYSFSNAFLKPYLLFLTCMTIDFDTGGGLKLWCYGIRFDAAGNI